MQNTKDIPGYHSGCQDHKAISRVEICTGNILNYLLCCSTVVWGDIMHAYKAPKREFTQTKVTSVRKPILVNKYVLIEVISKYG